MKKLRNLILIITLISILNGCCYHNFKSMPVGTDYKSDIINIAEPNIDFLYDITYKSEDETIIQQEIFDTVFAYIDSAQTYILIDMFLFNSYLGKADKPYRNISRNLADKLIEKIQQDSIKIDFITDPINSVYGGVKSKELSQMKKHGINVIETNLNKLPDSNKFYSPIWRTFFQWFGNSSRFGIFPHPFESGGKSVTLRSYLKLLNFKANHRKVFVTDTKNDWVAIVTSANPHTGSSAHSNVGVLLKGNIAHEIFVAENAVADFSKKELSDIIEQEKDNGEISVRLITENEIEKSILKEIKNTTEGDSIKIGMFYLSDRDIIESLLSASERNVDIKLILDPNKDAFGRKKNGIPNRPVANELHKKSKGKIKIRWYSTHGEQFHSKFVYIQKQDLMDRMIVGSANLTKRNIGNYNLEMNLWIRAERGGDFISEIDDYYRLIWNGDEYTADYAKYAEDSFWKGLLYRFTEAFGASTY